MKSVVAMALIFGLPAMAQAIAKQPPPAPAVADDAESLTIWKADLTASTNVRYWSALADDARKSEHSAMLWGVFLGAAGIVVAMIPRLLSIEKKVLRIVDVSTLIDVVAVVIFAYSLTFFFPSSTSYAEANSLTKRWSSLATEWETLLNNRGVIRPKDMEIRIELLTAEEREIENAEPGETNHPFLQKAQADELHSRGLDKWITKHDSVTGEPIAKEPLNGAK